MTTAEESVATSARLARESTVTGALGTDSATCESLTGAIRRYPAAQLRNGPSQEPQERLSGGATKSYFGMMVVSSCCDPGATVRNVSGDSTI